MPLTQHEADALLQMPKEFVDDDPLEFSRTQPMDYDRLLQSVDRREQFILDIERGRRNRARLKYQTRARVIVILARLEVNGPAHRNPPESPYRPGERMAGPHMHLYKEAFEARIAFDLADVPGLVIRDINDGILCLEDFLRFCGVQKWPNIQVAI
jgi:hypothetical protein